MRITVLCKKHPKYKGMMKPRVACEDCWWVYFAVVMFKE